MCGIFLINKNYNITLVKAKINFNKGICRGPDNSTFLELKNYYLGFHRLSINGLNSNSNQPFFKNNVYCICNGEIYNYKYIYYILNIRPETKSDCEIILDLYLNNYSIYNIVNILDGVFSFIILDLNKNQLFVARDPIGIRPLFYSINYDNNNINYSFASETKQLLFLNKKINFFPPGHYLENDKFMCYYLLPHKIINNEFHNIHHYQNIIQCNLINAVRKRLLSDRPIACLLSGGLDSSLITSIVSSLLPKHQQLHTFSIGMKGSTDLFNAKIVSDYLKTIHTEIILTEDEFFNAIPEVIDKIESFDTTTVRASVGNYLICKYISKNTDFKVIFNGDGSDELTGGYLYFHKAPNEIDAHNECIRLLKDIHLYDVLRSDRCISSCGLEPRTPFLDKTFINTYLSIPLKYRFPHNKIEKYLLRNSFEKYLPEKILYRTKEAFSDGVSSETKSWYSIIQNKLKNSSFTFDNLQKSNHLKPITLEQQYYRYLYNKSYKNQSHLIPYFWMPKWSNTNDPSARTL
jgi:asparagine synthase (glutamine-hydrolysing)